LRAVVRGTVFAVGREAGRSRVEVFEGRVEIFDAQGEIVSTLDAGEAFTSESDGAGKGFEEAIVARGRRWARARASHALDAVGGTRTSPAAHDDPAGDPSAAAATAVVSLAEARALVLAGEWERARDAARRARGAGVAEAEWAMVEGDALRRGQRDLEAIDAYERAARKLPPSRATQAGYVASRLAHAQGQHE